MIVNILGTEYEILELTEDDQPYLKECDGFCDRSRKQIVIAKMYTNPNTYMVDIDWYKKKVLRHEIIHAFLHESGLEENSNSTDAWSRNEEMVDWIAIQFPKIQKAFESVGAL